jgi:hypothetical protein
VEFVIQLLKEKKKEIETEYASSTDFIKVQASKLMTEQINKAIWTLEYEHYWKGKSEKQIGEIMGINKRR